MKQWVGILVLALSTLTASADQNLVNLNKGLIDLYRSSNVRERGGAVQLPDTVVQATEVLKQNGITVFTSMLDLSRAAQKGSSASQAVMHEYVRRQILWGMPWLPLSWTRQLDHIEQSYPEIARGMARTLDGLTPIENDKLLVAYLFSGSIIHTNNSSLIEKIRTLAAELGEYDRDFFDIRVEVHQEPSMLTVSRVEDYISKTTNASYKAYAVQIKALLEAFLGNADLNLFLKTYSLSREHSSALLNAQKLSTEFTESRTQEQVKSALEPAIAALQSLSQQAFALIKEIKDAKITTCDTSTVIDCSYEMFDLLKQYQTLSMSLSVSLHHALVKHDIAVSPKDFLSIVRALVVANISIGLMDEGSLRKIDTILEQDLTSATELRQVISTLEADIGRMESTIKGAFATELGSYSKFIPKLNDNFVADTMRSTTALPLANIMSSMYQSLQQLDGVQITIRKQRQLATFRVLNPGVAKGKLKIADPKKMNEEGFRWDPNAIYILEKTPAEIQKVAGILTADSGSAISHVQLLAGNHGIPNVFVSASLIAQLKKMDGQEVFIASLPNGEAIVKLTSEMSSTDTSVLNEYLQFKEKQRVTLSKPTRLDIDYPMRLEQLRIEDSGVIAGGKACGQGELARVFPNTVPQALVLPFGVYYSHTQQSGLYKMIEDTFKDPKVNSSKEARAKAFEKIRKEISKIKFDSKIVKTINAFISQPQFSEAGFFVRSDTNAEDLPQFVGAGLNLTVPNVRGLDNVLAAVREVWSSPFTEKAMSWREDLIRNPWDIFPSVVIQVGVSSEKAGVMVVGDPNTDDFSDKVLIAGNEGVGITTVNGEFTPEEVEYSRKKDTYRRLRKAYAKEKKVLGPNGVQNLPSLGLDPLFTEEEIKALAQAGDKIQKSLSKDGKLTAWDLEFGLIDGKVILFQIRPFIGNKIMRNVAALTKLQSEKGSKTEAQLTVNDRGLVLFDYKKIK